MFKKYYCAKCGTKLEKERTHRVVTKNDRDYYRYHKRGRFPQPDYDVYDYRFQCPGCDSRISFDEQRIIEKIQKQKGQRQLSSFEIRSNYKETQKAVHKKALITNIICTLAVLLVVAVLFVLLNPDKGQEELTGPALSLLAVAVIAVVGTVKRFEGNGLPFARKPYSYAQEMRLKKLHAHSSHNKVLILVSDRCVCFHCQAMMDHGEITEYVDNGQTALCPKCGVDAILPDSIEETIDSQTLKDMQEYWF